MHIYKTLDFCLKNDGWIYMKFMKYTHSISSLKFYLNCWLTAEQHEFVMVKIISFLHDQYYNKYYN